MTFQQLNYLVEISKCGSINKAAQKLFLSQSGISIAIKELEEELNIKFFIRTNRGVTFTPEGKEFLSHAVSLLDSKKRLEKMYSQNHTQPASTYFSISSQRYPFVQDAFMNFVNKHNDESYRLQLIETGLESVVENVSEHNADIGIISESDLTEKIVGRLLESHELIFHQLSAVKPCVYMREGHPLSEKPSLTEQDLSGYPYITFEQSQGVAIDFSEECQLFSNNTAAQRIIINTRETSCDIIRTTDAVTTGSGLLSDGISPKGILTVPLTGLPDIKLGYILPTSTRLNALGEEFVGLLSEAIQSSIAYTASINKK